MKGGLGAGVVWAQAEGFAERGGALGEAAEQGERGAQIEVGVGERGIEADRLGQMAEGVLRASELQQCRAEIRFS